MSLVRAGFDLAVTAWTDGGGRCLYKGADAGPFNGPLITTGDDSLCAKTLKWIVLSLLALIVIAAVGGYLMVRSAGHPKVDGELKLAGLTAPVKVLRDELGMPYIFAANTPDLLRAQGFVTAQNRLHADGTVPCHLAR